MSRVAAKEFLAATRLRTATRTIPSVKSLGRLQVNLQSDCSFSAVAVGLVDVLEDDGAFLFIKVRRVGARQAFIQNILNRHLHLRPRRVLLPPVDHKERLQLQK